MVFSTLKHLFTPHHSNNHRPRILHPAGLVVCMSLLLLLHSGVELIKIYEPGGLVLGYASNITVDQVIAQTNSEREKVGLGRLVLNEKLSQAAAAKAADMFAKDYWAHISPEGVPPWTFIKNTGYRYTVAGENLARDFDDTPTMIAAWMASPTHKANLVHTKYTETGIAVVNGKLDGIETTLVVHMFGTPTVGALEADQPIQPQPQISAGQQITEVAPQGAPQPAVLSQTLENTAKVYVSPLALKRSVVLSVIALIVGVLILDEVIIRSKRTVRFVGKNFAHVSLLVAVTIIIMTMLRPGGIL